MTEPSPTAARVLLVVAAVLWSLGSFFMRVLREPTALGLHEPELTPVQIAVGRALFGGLGLLPLVPWKRIRWRPLFPAMVLCFAIMNGLYLTALGLGSAANAILLQNTAPVWVYLVGVHILKEPTAAGAWKPIALAMAGAGVIVVGNWPWNLGGEEQSTQIVILLMALGSGVMYAGVITGLGHFRDEPPAFLMVLNLFGGGVMLAGFVWCRLGTSAWLAWMAEPTLAQYGWLAVFGLVQMALPYVLFARGLQTISPTEAAIITLVEPLLNPVWAYLIAPDKEVPTPWTMAGGAVLLVALAWNCWPKRGEPK